MSKQHKELEKVIMGSKPVYDPNNHRDYKKDRNTNELLDIPLDSRICLNSIKELGFDGEFLEFKENSKDKVILYIHGGGFVGGSAKTRRDITSYYVLNSGLNVYSNNYPLAFEEKYPGPQNACFKAYKYLVNKYGGNNIVIMGESAGGTLVLSTLLMAKDNKVELPCCAIVFSPATQFIEPTKSYFKNDKKDAMCSSNIIQEVRDQLFENNNDAYNPYASPLLGDYKGMCDIYVVASDSEVLFDDSVRLVRKLKQDKVNVKFVKAHNKMHAFPMIASLPESIRYNNKVIKYIHKHIV